MPDQSQAELLALQEALAGHYSVERELGRGGMGVVYLAREIRLDRPVALKVLPTACAREPALRARFLAEARLAAKLSHPHIVAIYAVHELDDLVFFAMAFVQGETLGQRVRERGPLASEEAGRILREVSWALAYAHAQGVVHRDVKPDNILLEMGSGRAMVTDFGIARAAAEAAGVDASEPMGTPEFMSPEQVAGAHADARSDLYGLGMVGHFLLSGRVPLRGATAAETLAKHLTESAPPLASIVPGLPTALSAAIDRCLERDPGLRFADGEALARAIGQALPNRREIPTAIRIFLNQSRESGTAMAAILGLGLCGLFMTAGGAMDGVPMVWLVITGLGSLTLASVPVAVLVRMVRRLLRAGSDHGDLVRALEDEVAERRAELEGAFGPERAGLDRWLKRLLVGSVGVTGAAFGWLMFGRYVPGVYDLVGMAMTTGAIVGLSAGAVAAVRHQLRRHVAGERWLGFWKSFVGRSLFAGSRLGLDTVPNALPYGPTEVVIGSGVDRLFAALPAELRRALPELPAIARALRAHAERIRSRLRALDEAGGEVPSSSPLPEARVDAERQLSDVVAALERIRVELVRLHAGAGGLEAITADLGAAKSLASALVRLSDGRREVDRILDQRPAGQLEETPTPA